MKAFVYNNVQSPGTASKLQKLQSLIIFFYTKYYIKSIHFAWHRLYIEHDKIRKANGVKMCSDFGIHVFQDSES